MANKTATAKTPKAKEAFKVEQKRSGRWAVVGADGKFVNGEAKVKVLAEKGLIKVMTKKAAPAAAE